MNPSNPTNDTAAGSEKGMQLAFRTSEYRGYIITACYKGDGSGLGLIEMWKGVDCVNHFDVHAYKIWNYSAHYQDLIDQQIELEDTHVEPVSPIPSPVATESAAPKWISVDQELPPNRSVVLVRTEGGYKEVCVYRSGFNAPNFEMHNGFLVRDVKHWMAIPELEAPYVAPLPVSPDSTKEN